MPTPLEQAKAAWIAQSVEEEFFFAAHDEPVVLRRSKSIIGGLASLVFGCYQAMDESWIEDDRAVWLGMITSDVPGHGGKLLDALTRSFGKLGLVIIGTPSAQRPTGWDERRPFDTRPEVLLMWYMRHGFRIVQNGSDTRVVHARLAATLVTSFKLG